MRNWKTLALVGKSLALVALAAAIGYSSQDKEMTNSRVQWLAAVKYACVTAFLVTAIWLAISTTSPREDAPRVRASRRWLTLSRDWGLFALLGVAAVFYVAAQATKDRAKLLEEEVHKLTLAIGGLDMEIKDYREVFQKLKNDTGLTPAKVAGVLDEIATHKDASAIVAEIDKVLKMVKPDKNMQGGEVVAIMAPLRLHNGLLLVDSGNGELKQRATLTTNASKKQVALQLLRPDGSGVELFNDEHNRAVIRQFNKKNSTEGTNVLLPKDK